MSDAQKSTGNILSNVSPPSQLPSFVTAMSGQTGAESSEPFIPTTFSAAIPPNKDTSTSAPQTENLEENVAKHSSDFRSLSLNPEPVANALSPITQQGTAIYDWMKGAFTGNTIIQKVVDKTMTAVDTVVTTLDPQMKEYIS